MNEISEYLFPVDKSNTLSGINLNCLGEDVHV